MSVTVEPTAAELTTAASGPTVVKGQGVKVSQLRALAELAGASLRVSQLRALAELAPDTTVTPAAALLTFSAQEPTISGGLTVAPAAAELTSAASGPTVVYGSSTIAPAAASLTSAASGPTVILGLTIAPPTASLSSAASGPTVVLGSVTVTPAAAVMDTTTTTPQVLGVALVAPAAATAALTATAPTVGSGHIVTPAAAILALTAADPLVFSGQLRTSQVIALAEIVATQIEVSQVVALAELANDTLRVSQIVVLVELVEPPPARSGRHQWRGITAPTIAPRFESVRTAAAQAQIQAGLAAAATSLAPQTILRAGGGGGGNMATADVRTLVFTVEFDWGRGGSWVAATNDVISVRGSQSLVAPGQALAGGGGTTDRVTIILANAARKYSSRNTGSALYSSIANGGYMQVPVRVSVTIDLTSTVIFTGVIRGMTEQGATPTTPATVTIDCRSRDDLLLQRRHTTTAAEWAASQAGTYTEDWHIIALLEAAGWVDGTDFVSQDYALAHPGTARTIDPGVFPLPYVWLDNEAVLSKIWQLAGAGGGWFYVDGAGVAHYHNMAGLLPAMLAQQFGSVAAYVVDIDNVAGLSLSYADADLYSEVTVSATPRSAGETAVLWQPANPIVVQPSDTPTVWATFSQPATEYTGLTWTATTAGGLDISSNVTVTATYYPQRVKLAFTNANTSSAYIGNLKIRGVELTEDETIDATETSTASFWSSREERKRAVKNNPAIQTETHARALARYLLDRAETPQLVATVQRVDDPAVNIGRLVEVDYDTTVNDTISGVVVGVDWSGDRTGLRWDVRVMELGGAWAAVSPYFILDTHKLGNSGASGEAYLFY